MFSKTLGVILVIIGCGGFGALVAASYKQYTKLLQQLLRILSVMECELQYRMTPLPELCRISANICTGRLHVIFLSLSEKLNANTANGASQCMLEVISETTILPKSIERILLLLGDSLGRFELDGQIKGISFVRTNCEDMLKRSISNQDVRIRSYRTLAICAGAALAILLI